MKTEKWVKIGSIGVDSGQMMLIDPCYFDYWKDDKADEDDFKETGKMSYSGACGASMTKKKAGILKNKIKVPLACVCSAGFGDGIYDVFVKYSDEGEFGIRVAEMKIVFIPEE